MSEGTSENRDSLPDNVNARLCYAALLRRLHTSEASALTVLAVLVGVGAGLGAVAFRWLIATAQHLFFDGSASFLDFLGPYRVVPVPAAGGLLVGLMTYYLAREAKGHGVPGR